MISHARDMKILGHVAVLRLLEDRHFGELVVLVFLAGNKGPALVLVALADSDMLTFKVGEEGRVGSACFVVHSASDFILYGVGL